MHKSDVFVIFDDVQYDKNGWRNRNRIKTASGAQWLTVPVRIKFDEQPLIIDVAIDNTSNWSKKHLASIMQNYSRAPFFAQYIRTFEEAFSMEWTRLVDLDMHFIKQLAGLLGADANKIVRSSSLGIKGDRIERLIRICHHFNADIFYEGAAGRDYLDENIFKSAGISIEFQNYKHPIYSQLYGDFLPYMSVIDLLFNCGGESMSIIMNEQDL